MNFGDESEMRIWIVYRTDEVHYDEYDSAVVIADTEDQAKSLFPGTDASDRSISLDSIVAELIGKTNKDAEKKYHGGIICSSYNAG